MSVISGDAEFDGLYKMLKLRIQNHILYEIQPLTDDEIYKMQDSYLAVFKRRLQPQQSAFFKKLLLNEDVEKQTVFRNRLFLSIAKVCLAVYSEHCFSPNVFSFFYFQKLAHDGADFSKEKFLSDFSALETFSAVFKIRIGRVRYSAKK